MNRELHIFNVMAFMANNVMILEWRVFKGSHYKGSVMTCFLISDLTLNSELHLFIELGALFQSLDASLMNVE